MALTDENGMVMPVAPMYGANNGSGFGNGWGGDGFWIILLFILLGGWGNGYGNGGNGTSGLYPWMNHTQDADVTLWVDIPETGIRVTMT